MMIWRCPAGLLAAAQLFSLVYSAGTTVWVAVDSCPATTTSLATGLGVPDGTSTPLPLYFLSVSAGSSPGLPKERRDAGPSYITLTGSTTGDCNKAATYAITQSGQLMSEGQLISTTGLLPNAPFAPSPNIASISTTFSASNGFLQWNNTAFVENRTLFCQTGSTVKAVFNGQLPSGCAQVTLSLLLVSPTSCPTYDASTSAIGNLPTSASTGETSGTVSITLSSPFTSQTGESSYPGSLSSKGVVADLIGGYVYASTATVLSGLKENIVSLEQCLSFCTGYRYFGVSEGNLCTCGNVIASGAMPAYFGSCTTACTGSTWNLCGGSSCIVVFGYRGTGSNSTTSIFATSISAIISSVVSGPSTSNTSKPTTLSITATTSYLTSTGTPNCLDRSPFTGTVNGGYLILCNTDLPGYDLAQVNSASLADCIAACNSYVAVASLQPQPCVALEYDQDAATNACHLKYAIGVISNGGNATAQAAVLVNQPNAPPIVYSTTSFATSSMTSMTSVGLTPTTETITTSAMLTLVPTTRSSTVFSPPSSSMMASISTSSISAVEAPPPGSLSRSLSVINTPSSASITANILSPNSNATSSAVDVLLTSSKLSPSASATGFCPGSNHQIISQGLASYEVECSKQLLGNVLTGNTTTASSLQQCFGFCNLFNLAQPFGCVGVNYLRTITNFNCLLLSTVTDSMSSPFDDSGHLIYAGYSSITDAPLTISSTPIALSSLPSSSTLPSVIADGTSSTTRPSSSMAESSVMISPVSATVSSITISSPIITSLTSNSNILSFLSANSSSIGLPTSALSSTITLITSITSVDASLSTATSSGTCGATTSTNILPIPASALCPGTAPGTVYGVGFSGSGPGSGTPYEIECSTNFAGIVNQPVVALSLQDCINVCQQYKYQRQLPCYAVSFNNSAAALNLPPQNNCNLFNTLTSVTYGVSQFDSARIVSNSSGYTNVDDYCLTNSVPTSSTTVVPAGGQFSAPRIGPANRNVGNVPTTTTNEPTVQAVTAGAELCPGSNMTVVQDGKYKYEIECGLYYGGHDIGKPTGYTASPTNLDGCIIQCNFWNENVSLGHTCIYALYAGPPINSCYNKDSVTGTRAQMAGYNIARLIKSAYPTPTDLS